MLEGCRIKDVPTTSKNPQANAICERMHQTVGNVLRTLLHGQPPQQITGARAKDFIDEALAIAMHAIRAGIHSTLGSSPGSLVFNRDMFLNIPLIADWHAVSTQPYVCVDQIGQSRTRLNVLHADAVQRHNRPSGDQLA